MINGLLNTLSELIRENTYLAPFIAFFAGALTSMTPCSLSSIPLVIGYVGNTAENTKKALSYSIVFALGSATVFTAMGTAAALAGTLIGQGSSWWYIVLGILMVLMALQTWEIYDFIPSTHLIAKNKKRGYLGALLSGMLGGLFSSPCATPALVALLLVAASSDNIAYSILLLLSYSIGHGVLTVLAGTGTGFIRRMRKSKASSIAKFILGLLILALGLYMFYLGF